MLNNTKLDNESKKDKLNMSFSRNDSLYKFSPLSTKRTVLWLRSDSFRSVWSWIRLIGITYYTFICPFRVGFVDDFEEFSALLYLDYVLDLFFVFDLLLYTLVFVNMKYIDERKTIDMNRIATLYIKSSVFYLSFGAVLPLDVIIGMPISWRTVYWFRLTKLLHLVSYIPTIEYLWQLSHQFMSQELTVSPLASRVFKLCGSLLLALHLFACAFYFVGVQHDGTDRTNWFQSKTNFELKVTQSLFERYSTTIYWSILTLTSEGYGDIVPIQQDEVILAIIVMLFGWTFYGRMIGHVAPYLQSAPAPKVRYLSQISQLQSCLHSEGVPTSTQNIVTNYYKWRWERFKGIEENSIYHEDLPPFYRRVIGTLLFGDSIRSIKYFRSLSTDILQQIVTEIDILPYVPGQYIAYPGAVCDFFGIVLNGEIQEFIELNIPSSICDNLYNYRFHDNYNHKNHKKRKKNGRVSPTNDNHMPNDKKHNNNNNNNTKSNNNNIVLPIHRYQSKDVFGFNTMFSKQSLHLIDNWNSIGTYLYQITVLLKDNITMKDRIHRLKTFPQCFIGYEAIQWLLKLRIVEHVNEAIGIGNLLLKFKLIKSYGKSADQFRNRYQFYTLTLENWNMNDVFADKKIDLSKDIVMNYGWRVLSNTVVVKIKYEVLTSIINNDVIEQIANDTRNYLNDNNDLNHYDFTNIVNLKRNNKYKFENNNNNKKKNEKDENNNKMRRRHAWHYRKGVILPQSQFRLFWDLISLILVSYNSILIPFRAAFWTDWEIVETDWYWFTVDWSVDLFFIIDIYLRLRHFALPNPIVPDLPITARRIFSTHYLKTTFLIDVIAALPLDVIEFFLERSAYRIILLRLPKLLRVYRFRSYFLSVSGWAKRKLGAVSGSWLSSSSYISILKYLAATFLVLHWIACGWFIASDRQNSINTWVEIGNLKDASRIRQYIRALDWSIITWATVGYGDITPYNLTERLISIGAMIFVTLSYFLVVAKLTVYAENLNESNHRFEQRIGMMNFLMNKAGHKEQIRDRVRRFQRFLWKRQRGYGLDNRNILLDIPKHLRNDILSSVAIPILYKIPSLSLIPNLSSERAFLYALCEKLDLHLFASLDWIVRAGTIATHTFLLISGEVRGVSHKISTPLSHGLTDDDSIQTRDSTPVFDVITLIKGNIFGDEALDLHVDETPIYTYTFRALSSCSIYILSRDDFINIIKKYEHINNLIGQENNYKINNIDINHDNNIHINNNINNIATNINYQEAIPATSFDNDEIPHFDDNIWEPSKSNNNSIDTSINNKGDRNFRVSTGISRLFTEAHEREARKLRGNHKWLLPKSSFDSIIWFIRCLSLLYFVIIVPLRIGFSFSSTNKLTILSLCIDGIFDFGIWIEIACRRFIVMEWDAVSGKTFTPYESFQRYIKRNIWLDILSTCPLDNLLLLSSMRLLIWFRLLRLLRLIRLDRFYRKLLSLLDDFHIKYSPATTRIIKLLTILLFTLHIFACIWHYVGISENAGNSWIYSNDSPVFYNNTLSSDVKRYLLALYFASMTVSTVGYGDISPKTTWETVVALCFIASGCVLYATVTANIAALLANRDRARAAFEDRVVTAREYVNKNPIPDGIKLLILSYFENLWNDNKGVETSKILGTIPRYLCSDLQSEQYMLLLRKLNLQTLNNVPKKFHRYILRSISSSLHTIMFQAPITDMNNKIWYDYITKYGTMSDCMYIIEDGLIEILTYTNEREQLLNASSYDNEYIIIGEDNLNYKIPIKQEFNIRTLNKTSALCLYRVDYQHILECVNNMKTVNEVWTLENENESPSPYFNNETIMNGGGDKHSNIEMLPMSSSINISSIRKINIKYNSKKDNNNSKNSSKSDSNNKILRNISTDNESIVNRKMNNLNMLQGSHQLLRNVDMGVSTRIDQNNAWLIQPDSKFRRIWGLLCLFALFFYLLLIPAMAAFRDSNDTNIFWVILSLSFIMDFIFLIDFIFHLFYFIPMHNKWRYEIRKKSDVTTYYFSRKKWIFDVISILPLDVILIIIYISVNSDYSNLPRYIGFFRLNHLFIGYRYPKYINNMEDFVTRFIKLSYPARRIAKVFLIIALCLHWIACIWYTLAKSFDFSKNWLTEKDGIISNTDQIGQYIYSLYWSITSLTTTGYGDITPQNSLEICFVLFVILVGDILYADIIGSISIHVRSKNLPLSAHTNRLQYLNEYLKYRQLPLEIRNRVLAWQNHVWTKGYLTQIFVLNQLPTRFAHDITFYTRKDIIERIPFFQSIDNVEIISKLCSLMKWQLYLPGDTIYSKNDSSSSLYYVLNGKIFLHRAAYDVSMSTYVNDAIAYNNNIRLKKPGFRRVKSQPVNRNNNASKQRYEMKSNFKSSHDDSFVYSGSYASLHGDLLGQQEDFFYVESHYQTLSRDDIQFLKDVRKTGKHPLALSDTATFGERSFFLKSPRFCTATSESLTEIMTLNREDFIKILLYFQSPNLLDKCINDFMSLAINLGYIERNDEDFNTVIKYIKNLWIKDMKESLNNLKHMHLTDNYFKFKPNIEDVIWKSENKQPKQLNKWTRTLYNTCDTIMEDWKISSL